MTHHPETGSDLPSRAAEVEPPVCPFVPAGGSAVLSWPSALTPPLREVLGLMCFQLGGYAHIYARAGEFVAEGDEPLGKRAEDEQAFMLHKLVGFALLAGAEWPKLAQQDLDRAKAAASKVPHGAV